MTTDGRPELGDREAQRPDVVSSAPGDRRLPEREATQPQPGPAIVEPAAWTDRYRFLRVLAEGGQAVVWEAEQLSTGRRVAVKQLRRGTLATDLERFRFQREIEVLASLDHEAIVRIVDAGDHDGAPVFAMELVEGRDVDAYARDVNREPRTIAKLFRAVCSGLSYAHDVGIIHRDLKPENLLVDTQGQPRILDFGVARLLGRATLTEESTFVGTWDYAAPEQVMPELGAISVRTDVYALGMLLYRALTGGLPYSTRVPISELAASIVHREAEAPSKLAPGVDPDLDAIVLRALRKDPRERYAGVRELGRDLERYLEYRPVEARSPTAGYLLRRFVRRSWKAVVVMAVVASALAGAAVFAWRDARAREASARAREARDRAEAERVAEQKRADQVAEFVERFLGAVGGQASSSGQLDPAMVREATYQSIIRAPNAWRQMVPAAVRVAVEGFRQAGQIDTALVVALDSLKSSLETATHESRKLAEDTEIVALMLIDANAPAPAVEFQRRAVRMFRRHLGSYHRRSVLASVNLARALAAAGDLPGAEWLLHAQWIRPAASGDDELRAAIHLARARVLLAADRWTDAVGETREGLEIRRMVSPRPNPALWEALELHGESLLGAGEALGAEITLLEALDCRREVLGIGSPSTGAILSRLATAVALQGRHHEASLHLEDALAMQRVALGDERPESRPLLLELGRALRACGRTGEAKVYEDELARLPAGEPDGSVRSRWLDVDHYLRIYAELDRLAPTVHEP